MRNDDDHPAIEYDEDELRLLAQLPREAPLVSEEADRLIQQLKGEGFFPRRRRQWRGPLLAAAAMILVAVGFAAGRAAGQRGSLEDMLAKPGLSVADRVLLLQRAGSAYVQAAQSYADATAHIDSSAVEVASKVLLGAAHAVARNGLDAGLAARLTTTLQPSEVTPVLAPRKPVIWF